MIVMTKLLLVGAGLAAVASTIAGLSNIGGVTTAPSRSATLQSSMAYAVQSTDHRYSALSSADVRRVVPCGLSACDWPALFRSSR